MKSSVVFILTSAMSSGAMASVAPQSRVQMAPKGYKCDKAVGAAYFMTNEPTGNYLVSAAIESDAKLTLYEASYTGGVGAHGLPAPPGLDALFSQGSVGVSTSRNYVANVNAGSNTVSVFAIDRSNPASLSLIGKPVSSNGEFPNSLVINNDGSRVCVVNGGKVNGVSCYTFDARKGLTPLKNTVRSLKLNQTTPATGPPNTPSQIIFSPDETQLIVSVKSAYLAIWDIAKDGSLSTDFKTVAGGVLPFSLIFKPGTNLLVASDPGIGYDIFDLTTESRAKAIQGPIPGQRAVCWSTYSTQSGNFYMIDVGSSTFTEVHVPSLLNSTIVKQYNLGTDGPIDTAVAKIGRNDFMYVLAANATGLTVVSVNGPGKAQVIQRVDIAGPAKAAKLPLHNTNLQGMGTYLRD